MMMAMRRILRLMVDDGYEEDIDDNS
jgi:hypothetical protein